MFTDLDKHLEEASPGHFLDAESRLLAKLWNDNDDIEEELRERVSNSIAGFHFFSILCHLLILRHLGFNSLLREGGARYSLRSVSILFSFIPAALT